jgi:hypothetical protein
MLKVSNNFPHVPSQSFVLLEMILPLLIKFSKITTLSLPMLKLKNLKRVKHSILVSESQTKTTEALSITKNHTSLSNQLLKTSPHGLLLLLLFSAQLVSLEPVMLLSQRNNKMENHSKLLEKWFE